MKLTIQNISKTYNNDVQALRNVNLEIDNGMFGLLGPNGAGKSTLMRTIAALQDADHGSIQFGDIDISKDQQSLREILGYLPQEFGVYPKVSASDLLDHMAVMKGIINSKRRKEVVDSLLQQTNLWEAKDRKLGTYSGGMKQRFGIAQALLGDPKLIIVDEPTAGLDPMERNRFHNLLSEIGENVIVILSTHIVDDVSDLCNNMAIILSGDFNPDSAIAKIDRHFGDFESSPVNEYKFEKEDPIKSPIERTIKAPDASSLLMAYRLPKAGSREVYMATMLDMILNNSKAGLIDLNINQKQKAVGVYSGISVSTDYSYHLLGGSPTKGQTLQELRDLILKQLEIVKKGEFPDWLMPAIINDFKVRELSGLKSNRNRVSAINEAFVYGLKWEEKSKEINTLERITKEDIINFANSAVYDNNYVVIYKEQTQEDLERKKVAKPIITPLDIPKQNQSEFLKEFIASKIHSLSHRSNKNFKFIDCKNDPEKLETDLFGFEENQIVHLKPLLVYLAQFQFSHEYFDSDGTQLTLRDARFHKQRAACLYLNFPIYPLECNP